MDRYDDAGVPALSAAVARDWARGLVPWWVPRVLLIAWWVLAIAVSAVTDPTRCSAADPSACGPDPVFTVAAVFAFLTPVLLWVMPRAGCVFGIVFGVLDVIFDPAYGGRVAFGAHAIACLVVLTLLTAHQARIRRATSSRAAAAPVRLPAQLHTPWSLRIALAAGLVVLGAGLGLWFQRLNGIEQQHLNRAQLITVSVAQIHPDGPSITLSVPGSGERTTEVLYNQYHRGDAVPVLVDPLDAHWIRLVAEPYDVTYWLTGAGCAFVLAVLLIWRESAVRRWRRDSSLRDLAAVRVLVDSDGYTTYLHTLDAAYPDAPFAMLATTPVLWPGSPEPGEDPTTEEIDWFAQAWGDPGATDLDDGIEPGILAGDLAPGGLAAVLLDGGILLPYRGLRPVRDSPPWWPSNWPHLLSQHTRTGGTLDDGFDGGGHRRPANEPGPGGRIGPQPRATETLDLPGRPIHGSSEVLPELPIEVRPSAAQIRWGWLQLAGCLVATVAGLILIRVLGLDPVLFGIGLFTVGPIALTAWSTVTHRILLEHAALTLYGTFFVYRVPWELLHGVRLDEDDVVIAWQPADSLAAGPFEDAERLAVLIAGLGERAAALGITGRDSTCYFRPGSLVVPAFGIAAAAGALLLSR